MRSKILPLTDARADTAFSEAASSLARGGVVAFPSDTCYGFAVDPRNPAAVRKLFALKRRGGKSVSCIFRDVSQALLWADVQPRTRDILENHFPGAFTFLLWANTHCPLRGEKIGVRIPQNAVTQKLSRIFGKPYTATSANVSGKPAAYNVEQLLAQFQGERLRPDLILDAGVLPRVPPSTVVDLTTTPPTIIRRGSGHFQRTRHRASPP